MSHKDIARHLHEKYQTSSISISRIVSVPINIPINILYDFWNNDSKRGKW